MIPFPRPSFLALALLAAPGAALAQEPGWDGEAEVGASFFFGNNEQSLVATRLKVAHADSAWQAGGEGRYTYGTSTDSEGESRLAQRAWNVAADLVYRPFAVVSGFASAGVESSFLLKIDTRWTGGGGFVWTPLHDETTQVDVRVGILAEKTAFDEGAAGLDPDAEDLLARGITRLHAKRVVGDERVVLESETAYRPELADFGRYVVSTTQSAAYRLTETFSLKLSLVDVYDSEAETRGARSAHDGQVLIGVLGSF